MECRYPGPPLEDWQQMSRTNSRNYGYGQRDAVRDMRLVAQHGGVAVGPTPNDPAYTVMYMRGYEETFRPVPHRCTADCRLGRAREPAR